MQIVWTYNESPLSDFPRPDIFNPHVVFRFLFTPVYINTGKDSLHVHGYGRLNQHQQMKIRINNFVFISMGFPPGHSILFGRRLAVHRSFRFSSYFRQATAVDVTYQTNGASLCSALNDTLLIESCRRKHLVSDEVSLDLTYYSFILIFLIFFSFFLVGLLLWTRDFKDTSSRH